MKKGFTLIEMLTTVALIGVLATILLPILQDSVPNKELLMFRKVFSTTERIVSELVNDDDLYPELSGALQGHYLANLSPATYHGNTFAGESKFAGLFMAMVSSVGDGDPQTGTLTTPDGIVWNLPVTDFSTDKARIISVDVNGNQGPNCYFERADECAHPDQFKIKIYNDGRVTPGGCMEKEYLQRKKTAKSAPISVIDLNNLDNCKENGDIAE